MKRCGVGLVTHTLGRSSRQRVENLPTSCRFLTRSESSRTPERDDEMFLMVCRFRHLEQSYSVLRIGL